MKQETATIRISKKVLRDLKAFLAPVDGKIKEFVEGAIESQIEARKELKKHLKAIKK